MKTNIFKKAFEVFRDRGFADEYNGPIEAILCHTWDSAWLELRKDGEVKAAIEIENMELWPIESFRRNFVAGEPQRYTWKEALEKVSIWGDYGPWHRGDTGEKEGRYIYNGSEKAVSCKG